MKTAHDECEEDQTLKQNGQAAVHYRKMFDRVSKLANIGVWECDLATGKLSWTDTVYDLFGLPRGSAISREETLKLYRHASRIEMERLRSRAIETGIGFILDIQLESGGGPDRWIRLTAEIEQEDGKSVRIFGTKQDISAEKAAQDQVHALQNRLIHMSRVSAMGAMASTLAHEVNQPLTAVTNYLAAARRLASRDSVPPDLARCIDSAMESTLHAGRTVRSVRDMTAKAQAGYSELDLGQVVREAARIAVAGQSNVALCCDVEDAPAVKADQIQVQQVLINLIRNACEAADGRQCQIRISGRPGETHYEICVSDDGPGIADSVLPRIFDAFVSTKPDGLGIGLSISRTIVEAHEGQLWATTSGQSGASFCFTLPLPKPRTSEPSQLIA